MNLSIVLIYVSWLMAFIKKVRKKKVNLFSVNKTIDFTNIFEVYQMQLVLLMLWIWKGINGVRIGNICVQISGLLNECNAFKIVASAEVLFKAESNSLITLVLHILGFLYFWANGRTYNAKVGVEIYVEHWGGIEVQENGFHTFSKRLIYTLNITYLS